MINMRIRLKPKAGGGQPKKVTVIVTKDNDLGKLRPDRLKAIENGLNMAVTNGPLLSFPVIDFQVQLLEFHATNSSSFAMVAAMTSQAITTAMKNADPVLLEPIMKLEIAVPDDLSGKVITDLAKRRSEMGNMSGRGHLRVIHAFTPLSELVHFATEIRILTSGRANLSMELDSYRAMTEQETYSAAEKINNFI